MDENIRSYLEATFPDSNEEQRSAFLARPEVVVLMETFGNGLQRVWADFVKEEKAAQVCRETLPEPPVAAACEELSACGQEDVGETVPLPVSEPSTPDEPPASVPEEADMPNPRFTLHNGRQGEPYGQVIGIESSNEDIRFLAIDIPHETGLSADSDSGRISGLPAVNGEFEILLCYRYASDPEGTERPGRVSLFINADPKSLWKDIPSDSNDPFWKEDEATQITVGPEAILLAARRRGRSHAHIGSFCDDDFFLHHDNAGGWYMTVVADGAGSAAFSRRGSQVAVRATGERLQQLLSEESGNSLKAAVADAIAARGDGQEREDAPIAESLYYVLGHAAHAAVRALYEEQKNRADVIASVRDLSTTLLIGIACRIGGKWFCASFWVGDGAVGIYRAGQGVSLLGTPDSGEYSGQTCFLDSSKITEEEIRKRIRYDIVDDMTAFVLMTDGVADPYFETEALLARKECWDRLWQEIEAEAGLSSRSEDIDRRVLEWLNFWSPGNHDDRTIAILF